MSILIGIDPDVDKNGVAYCVNGKLHFLRNLSFFQLFDYLKINKDVVEKVVIEAGWLNKSNWHKTNGSNSVNAQIGQRTGANHETGRKIVEMCEYLNLPYELVRPQKSKVDAKYFNRVTGWKGRTNQEQRDAGVLVWGR